MALDDVLRDVLVPFRFKRRAAELPPDLRPDWRIATILLLLKRCCRGGKSSLLRLHVLNWAIRSKHGQAAALAFVDGNLAADAVLVRYEPALNRALAFATAEGLVQHVGGRIVLGEKGKTLAAQIDGEQGLMEREKVFVKTLGLRLTEDAVNRLAARGGADVPTH